MERGHARCLQIVARDRDCAATDAGDDDAVLQPGSCVWLDGHLWRFAGAGLRRDSAALGSADVLDHFAPGRDLSSGVSMRYTIDRTSARPSGVSRQLLIGVGLWFLLLLAGAPCLAATGTVTGAHIVGLISDIDTTRGPNGR